MPAVTRLVTAALMLSTAVALTQCATTPAKAVGLGPLSKQGITDGAAKGFYLTLYNPYRIHAAFRVYAVGNDDEVAAERVRVPVTPLPLRPQSSRKFLIAVTGMMPGETYKFRVCAERFLEKDEPVHARVCSRLTARRVAGVAGMGGE